MFDGNNNNDITNLITDKKFSSVPAVLSRSLQSLFFSNPDKTVIISNIICKFETLTEKRLQCMTSYLYKL